MLAVRMFSANSKVPSPPWASSLDLFGHQLLSSNLDSRVVWNFQECVHVTGWPVAPPLTHVHAEASKAGRLGWGCSLRGSVADRGTQTSWGRNLI